MPAYAIDLHNHMPMHGGDYKGSMDTTGRDVVAAAIDAGIDVLGVTDHFALGFFHDVAAAAQGTGLLVLPGAELRLSWQGEEAHLIATFPPDGARTSVETLLDELDFGDEHRAQRPQQVVLTHDPVDVVALVHDLGGMAHVAHVDRCFGANRLLGGELLPRMLREAPLAAVEFLDLANAAELGVLASRAALIRSSDSHHTDEIGRRRTVIETDELTFAGVLDGLLRLRGSQAAAPAVGAL
jgi:hypothetical protein